MDDGKTFFPTLKANPGIVAIVAAIFIAIVAGVTHITAMSGANDAETYDTFVIVKETKVGMPDSAAYYYVHSFSYNFKVNGPAPSNQIHKRWRTAIFAKSVAEAKAELALLFVDNPRNYEVVEQFSLSDFAEYPIIEFTEGDYFTVYGEDARRWIVSSTLEVRAGSLMDCTSAFRRRMNEVVKTYAPDVAEPTDFSELMAAVNEHKLSEGCIGKITILSLKLRN